MHARQRRLHERASARFPIWLRCPTSGNVLQGHTANVSAGGMFLLTAGDSGLPLGADVDVVFGIRSEGEDGGYVLHKADDGAEIVRVERLGYGAGIAVKFAMPGVSRRIAEPMLS